MGMNTDVGLTSWVAAIGGAILLLLAYHFLTARTAAASGTATSDDYKRAVFNDLARGPNDYRARQVPSRTASMTRPGRRTTSPGRKVRAVPVHFYDEIPGVRVHFSS